MKDISLYLFLVLSLIGLYLLGLVNGLPDELENGCIVYNDNIYCKEG